MIFRVHFHLVAANSCLLIHDDISVHFTCTILNGAKIYSSHDHGKPTKFKLGQGYSSPCAYDLFVSCLDFLYGFGCNINNVMVQQFNLPIFVK